MNVSYAYSAKSDVLNQIEGHVDSEIFNQPLFTTDFVFLNAERMSPATAYEMSYDEVTNNHTIGIHGELTAHFLSIYLFRNQCALKPLFQTNCQTKYKNG